MRKAMLTLSIAMLGLLALANVAVEAYSLRRTRPRLFPCPQQIEQPKHNVPKITRRYA